MAAQWYTAIVTGCAIGEGIVIALFVLGRLGPVASGKPPEPAAPAAVQSGASSATARDETADQRSSRVAGRTSAPSTPPPASDTTATAGREPRESAPVHPIERGPILPRSGGIAIVSPIALQVYEGERLLGSTTDGVISASAGRRTFDLVNSALGYRARQVVDVKAGRVAKVNMTLPSGRVSVNAVPWAEVWIDGKPVGETPLGNLSVTIGEHEFVFRHPQLGERRQTATVRADGVTRVSADLQR